MKDSNRSEPTISLTLDDDDLAHRAEQKKSAPVAKSGGSGGSGLSMLLLFLVLGLGGAAYYLYDQLVMSQQALALNQQRLDALEDRLSAAGENLEENSLTTQVRLKELDSEVRKLWDNVWKKQKETLQEHEADLKKQSVAIAKLEKAQAADAVKLKGLDGFGDKLDRAVAQSEVNKKTLLSVQKEVAKGGNLETRIADLEKQMKEADEWLDSVNAFRRQVNRDLENLRQTMTQYHAASPQP
ncbi:hypothetical protein IB286_06720 [Spongiibacter sp. KMU-158]|uniref:Uncharacterized protein n=1 Tax=Spongiibacter pelagi TaxID=2760804 RepID=A0A927C314_9GAMM|nr:hypothetical protein [Spongiibacter pelagi]MBD2858701.1 hypothetical protein [Spongiibacter pelagi]